MKIAGLGSTITSAFLVHSSWLDTHGSQSFISETGDQKISITTLAQEWKNTDETIDLWILDIEGYEIHALEGALPLIQKNLIPAIYMEVDTSEKSQKSMNFLYEQG